MTSWIWVGRADYKSQRNPEHTRHKVETVKVVPAAVADKEGPQFAKAWGRAMAGPVRAQMELAG